MKSKEAKTHIIDTLNGDMNKEYFINELLPEILKDLERLEQIEKAQDLEIGNLKFIDNENKYQVAIRVLKEAFIVLGKSDITNTCWFKYLEELEKENKVLKACIKDWEDDYEHLEFALEKREKALEILKKYLYYDNKNHVIKMKEVRKSIYNFDYEYLKEVVECQKR